MFLLKKVLAQFLMPLPVASLLLLAALVFLFCTRRRKTPGVLVSLAALILLLSGNGLVADAVLRPLEARYPSYRVDAVVGAGTAAEIRGAPGGALDPRGPGGAAPADSIAYIVVLGAGHVSDPAVPVTSRVNDSAVVRLVEAVRLLRLHPRAGLIVSGGPVFDPVPSSQWMAELAVVLGVDPAAIIQADRPLDTKDEARFIAPLVGDARFLLVTCASHMPRAMALFEHQGLRPVAAPTHHLARRRGATIGWIFPHASSMGEVERAIHERVGLLWARLRGQA